MLHKCTAHFNRFLSVSKCSLVYRDVSSASQWCSFYRDCSQCPSMLCGVPQRPSIRFGLFISVNIASVASAAAAQEAHKKHFNDPPLESISCMRSSVTPFCPCAFGFWTKQKQKLRVPNRIQGPPFFFVILFNGQPLENQSLGNISFKMGVPKHVFEPRFDFVLCFTPGLKSTNKMVSETGLGTPSFFVIILLSGQHFVRNNVGPVNVPLWGALLTQWSAIRLMAFGTRANVPVQAADQTQRFFCITPHSQNPTAGFIFQTANPMRSLGFIIITNQITNPPQQEDTNRKKTTNKASTST